MSKSVVLRDVLVARAMVGSCVPSTLNVALSVGVGGDVAVDVEVVVEVDSSVSVSSPVYSHSSSAVHSLTYSRLPLGTWYSETPTTDPGATFAWFETFSDHVSPGVNSCSDVSM